MVHVEASRPPKPENLTVVFMRNCNSVLTTTFGPRGIGNGKAFLFTAFAAGFLDTYGVSSRMGRDLFGDYSG